MYKEDEYTELKSILTKEIKKEIVAFANSGGGKIYIGIDDNGNIIGLDNIKKDIESLSGMIQDGIKSNLTLYTNIKQEIINEKKIIILEILDAPNKPYYLSDKGLKPTGVYLRSGNTSVPASEEIIKKLIIDSQNLSFEELVSNNQNLHFEYIAKIFNDKNININDTVLKTLNIINLDNKYTNLGLLLSDECPFSIKCAIFEGNNDINFKDRKEFTGSLLKQVNEVNDYLNIYNRIAGKIIGLERIDTRDYPEYALREAILNAVIHRDYNYSGSILISLYDNHFEITSLGGLVKGLKIDDLYEGISQTRNKNLVNIFFRLNYVESFGTGIKRIVQSYETFDKKPIILSTENVFKVTLYNINYKEVTDKKIPSMLSQEERIIEYLKNNIKINRIIVEKLLEVSSTRAKTIIGNMIKNNIIEAVGSGKNIYYVLK
ncbi:MAG: AAA family ATPase [Bacilli bacterium]|nr:AAA family ATPase [Bacilli bacterium]MCI9434482.1 AAA family ATPase [Bacilli bacterium]